MSNTDEVLQFLRLAEARVNGATADPGQGADAVRYTRDRLLEAAPHAHAGAELPEGTRLKLVKKAMLGAVRPVTSNQGPFNRSILAAVDGAAGAIEALTHDVTLADQHADRVQAGLATTQLGVDDLIDDVRGLKAQVADLASSLDVIRAQQELILRTADEALAGEGLSTAALSGLSRELGAGNERLYQDLEDRFRGSRDEVQERLSPYLDDLREGADGPSVGGPVIDIGCGRGEWLELLARADIEGYGIDLNEVVVERCTARGLDVRVGDALAHLRQVEPGSIRAITAFHVAEHLSLDTLIGLVDAALVALAPGGTLILETPNPTNVNVGASSFYLDPTHLKPLHPQFLEFLVDQRGFASVDVRYLNTEDGPALQASDLAATGDPERAQLLVDRINWALSGPLDYCVIGHKAASAPLA